MKFNGLLFEGGSTAVQKRKKAAFYVICATLVAIAAMVIVLAIILASSAIKDAMDQSDQTDPEDLAFNIGATAAATIKDEDCTGALLCDQLTSTAGLVNIQNSPDRPKKDDGINAYTVLKAKQEQLYAAADAIAALNSMLDAFYKKSKDDTIIVYDAFDSSNIKGQLAVYSTATAFELRYFPDDDKEDYTRKESIYGVSKFNWIYTNAASYGFVVHEVKGSLGTDDDEKAKGSSIFRYVGAEHAAAIKKQDLSYEEYVAYLKNSTSPTSPLSVRATEDYAIYYLDPNGELLLPTEYEYKISGSATLGYVVSVNTSKKVSD